MIQASVGRGWQHALFTLTGTVVSVVVIATLYWAQSVFIPVALAAFLTFLLGPFVGWFRQRGLPRTPAVLLVVFLAALVLGGVGWLVTAQITSLLRELPSYTETLKTKVRSLKQATGGSSELSKMIVDINQEIKKTPVRPGEEQGKTAGESEGSTLFSRKPTAVIVEPQSPAWLSRLTFFLSPLLEYLGELALAIILVVFMLLKREELRNRVIRLAGQGRIIVATKFADEAGQRVSRFLLMQAVVNGVFGLIFGLGLLLIGVKYALLWGFLGGMLRYLPYIGTYLAAVFPVSMSLAISEGWGATLLVITLFLALELTIANFIEPRLYGQSMGVSEIALLVSAAFWAFLWGPIGLVLSSPLTVCLVVLGRYVPQLEFLAVLLGNEPALDSSIGFYQRLLARDQDEAEELVLSHIKEMESPDQVYDAMLLPALSAVKRNRVRGEITEDDQRHALQAIREIAEDVGEQQIVPVRADAGKSEGEGDSQPAIESREQPPIPILGCPAHDMEDQVALEMLQHLLDPARWSIQLSTPGTLTAELLDLVAEQKPALICIAATLPGGLAHTRYLCKRIRARFPDLKILVGRWGLEDIAPAREPLGEAGTDRGTTKLQNTGAATTAPAPEEFSTDPLIATLQNAGADLVATRLLETRRQLGSLLPILMQNLDDHERAAATDHHGMMTTRSANRQPRIRHAESLDMAAGVQAQ